MREGRPLYVRWNDATAPDRDWQAHMMVYLHDRLGRPEGKLLRARIFSRVPYRHRNKATAGASRGLMTPSKRVYVA